MKKMLFAALFILAASATAQTNLKSIEKYKSPTPLYLCDALNKKNEFYGGKFTTRYASYKFPFHWEITEAIVMKALEMGRYEIYPGRQDYIAVEYQAEDRRYTVEYDLVSRRETHVCIPTDIK